MLPLQLFTMSRIVQLTTQIFSDEAAQQKAVEMIKKRDHNEMAVLFPRYPCGTSVCCFE